MCDIKIKMRILNINWCSIVKVWLFRNNRYCLFTLDMKRHVWQIENWSILNKDHCEMIIVTKC